jgi:hypothetical protein
VVSTLHVRDSVVGQISSAQGVMQMHRHDVTGGSRHFLVVPAMVGVLLFQGGAMVRKVVVRLFHVVQMVSKMAIKHRFLDRNVWVKMAIVPQGVLTNLRILASVALIARVMGSVLRISSVSLDMVKPMVIFPIRRSMMIMVLYRLRRQVQSKLAMLP